MSANRLSCQATAVGGSGLGDIVVGAARPGYRTFRADDDGKSFTVLIQAGNAWEVRRGCVYTHSSTSLSRGTIEETSSAGNAAVAFTAGSSVTSVLSAADVRQFGALRSVDARTGNFALTAADLDATGNVTGASQITINGTLGQSFQFAEISRRDAASLQFLAGSGVTLTVVGGGAATVTGDGSSLVLKPSGTANKFYVHRIGS